MKADKDLPYMDETNNLILDCKWHKLGLQLLLAPLQSMEKPTMRLKKTKQIVWEVKREICVSSITNSDCVEVVPEVPLIIVFVGNLHDIFPTKDARGLCDDGVGE